jgi:hypothetical protein
MKLKVNRLLSAGKYHINFEVADLTPIEVSKMAGFGVPLIDLRWNTQAGKIPLDQINKTYNAVFGSEQLAKEYEQAFEPKYKQKCRGSAREMTSSAPRKMLNSDDREGVLFPLRPSIRRHAILLRVRKR